MRTVSAAKSQPAPPIILYRRLAGCHRHICIDRGVLIGPAPRPNHICNGLRPTDEQCQDRPRAACSPLSHATSLDLFSGVPWGCWLRKRLMLYNKSDGSATGGSHAIHHHTFAVHMKTPSMSFISSLTSQALSLLSSRSGKSCTRAWAYVLISSELASGRIGGANISSADGLARRTLTCDRSSAVSSSREAIPLPFKAETAAG